MATSNIIIQGSVSDNAGNSVPFSAQANQSEQDVITIVSATVSPDPAPAGTMRTFTVVATSSLGLPLTASVLVAPGSPVFTPVTGQPPGTFAWTFTY
jgi:hypothetical protein